MAAKKKVRWTKNSLNHLTEILNYRENIMSSSKALAYVYELRDFGNALETKSEMYSFCRNKKLQDNRIRCAFFKKQYHLIYKTNQNRVVILGVLHHKINPNIYEDLVD